MDLFLIRHGECCAARAEYYDHEKKSMNPPLTSTGEEQARKLAARCRNAGIEVVYSSDLLRAMQTSQILVSEVNCSLMIQPAFREIDMGDLCQNSWSDYPELYAEWSQHREDLPYPNGENGGDVWNRCGAQLREIVKQPYQKIAIVAHGGTIRSIICGVLGIEQQRRFYFGAPLENCSITAIRYQETEERFFLHTFNDFSHLAAI